MSFQYNTCNLGNGQTGRKIEKSILSLNANPENEKKYNVFLTPDSKDTYWYTKAAKCAEGGIQMDVYFFGREDADMATSILVSKWTGGDFHYFKNQENPELVHNKIYRVLSCDYVGDVAFKVRVSKQLQVSNYYGNILNKENSYIEISGFDADKSIAVEVQ